VDSIAIVLNSSLKYTVFLSSYGYGGSAINI